jgi:hypothetical protein
MRHFVSACACCWALVGCEAFVGEYSADLDQSLVVDTSELCAIDRTLAIPLHLDDADAEASLEDYYAAANPALVARLFEIAERFESGESHAGVTYLRGAAGVGKSFVTRNLTDAFDETEQCSIELADLFAASAESRGFEVELKADLATTNGEYVFNQLPTISEPRDFDIEALFDAIGCFDDGVLKPLIVLDGIDEVHDDSSRLILESVDDYVLTRDREAVPFVHVLISGRPEGFASWLTAAERTEENTALEGQFDLAAPKYDSAGDLAFRVEGYLEFALGEAFNAEVLAEYTESFTDALSRHPFLSYTIGNLAFGNYVIDQTAPGLDTSEVALKTRLFDDILGRNVSTHGRPGTESEFYESYRRALEDIAAKYIDVSQQGDFTVGSDDTVEAFDVDGASLGRLRVRTVLNRSGIAFRTDPRTTTPRYRFDPYWVQAHLIERKNQRLNADYEYRTCQ